MPRRLHVPRLVTGSFALPESEAHHARDVLRLTSGTVVELFDDGGRTAAGVLCEITAVSVFVRVESIRDEASPGRTRLTIASAVPKGDRADWMIEKLSELGVDRFIPLAAARSVVLPEGKNKRDRWVRIATEAAKQSRRTGVMRIDTLTSLADAGSEASQSAGAIGLCLSTEAQATPLVDSMRSSFDVTLFIGPEGGWTAEELRLFGEQRLTAVGLTDTILRVETAAVVAAAVVLCSTRTPPSAPSADQS